MMHIFLGHFWIFKLSHKVVESGYLITINILNALIILGLLNNPNSAHKYFQQFWK